MRPWTTADFAPAMHALVMEEQYTARNVLRNHGPHARHCGDYEVAAWPCPIAAALLQELERERLIDGRFA